ncbi:MAG: glycosyltransferase [Anaerolineae bacterium]|nr:glycosyltransferase [Anaerolineae bacterium]
MKLLFVVSSLDLTQPFSATPAWWQLMKGLYEIGVEVIATPYQGPAIESLWWRAEPNPAKAQGDAFKAARDAMRKIIRTDVDVGAHGNAPASNDESASDRLVRRAAQTLIAPLWLRHLDRLLAREPDIDAVIVLTAPLNHLVGVAGELQRRHHKPVFYYDGDVPASLPNMSGFASGFRIYQGADLTEYTAFISNSAGGAAAIKVLGARAVHPLFYGADPDVFSPVDVPAQDIDVLFYGHGREYRSEWIDGMIAAPSKALPDARFAVRGTKLGDLGRADMLPYLSFSKLREYACRSKINLCITRAAHASVFASSSSRPFELAGMGCCIVANPYDGIETWFEPGKEVFVVQSGEEALDRYRYLLAHDSERLAAGRAARERVLKEHTFRHRAQQLREIVKSYL